MASPNGSREPTPPHRSSELTIGELDNERTPLLPDDNKTLSGGGGKGGGKGGKGQEETTDLTTFYVQVLNTHLPWFKRPSVFRLLPILCLAWMTAGMLISSQGQFQALMLCREYLNRHTSNTTLASEGVISFLAQTQSLSLFSRFNLAPAAECQAPEIQAFTAKLVGLVEVLGGISTALMIGYYSSLSDKHGRKIVVILAFVATLIHLGAIIVMSIYWDQIGLPLMIIESIVSGLLGGLNLLLTMACAYTADCTDLAKRSVAFSWVHAALYLGLSVGPYVGGLLVRATGTILTIVYLNMIIVAFCLVLTVFFLPESLPTKQPENILRQYETFKKKTGSFIADTTTTGSQEQDVAWHSHILHSLSFFKPNGQNTNSILLAAISFLQMLAYRGTLSVVILYTNHMFNWTEYEDGVMFSLNSLVRLLSMIVILPILSRLHKQAFAKKQKKTRAKEVAEERRHGKQPQDEVQQEPDHPVTTLWPSNQTTTTTTTPAAAALPATELDQAVPIKMVSSSPATMKTTEEMFSDMKFDTWLIRLGFSISFITYIGYGLARNGVVFCLVTVIHSFYVIGSPSIKSLLTMLVEPSQFGLALGALQVVDSVSSVAAPITVSWLYAFTVKTMPQFVWYSLAFWAAVCVVLSFMIRQKEFRAGMSA